MQCVDDALAFADIIALAALADGVVTDSELLTIGYARGAHERRDGT